MLTIFLLAGAIASASIETPAEPAKTVAVENGRNELCSYSEVIPFANTPRARAQARAASLAVARAWLENAKTDQDKAIAQSELAKAETCAAPIQLEAPKTDTNVSKLKA